MLENLSNHAAINEIDIIQVHARGALKMYELLMKGLIVIASEISALEEKSMKQSAVLSNLEIGGMTRAMKIAAGQAELSNLERIEGIRG